MGTTILIPTDFSQRSLEAIRSLLFFQKEDDMRVFLVHGAYLDDSITELLFFSESRLRDELAGPAFLDGLKNLEEELKACVNHIQIILFKGRTQGQFDMLVESCGADRVLIPVDMEFNWTSKRSMDVLPFFRKAKIRKHAASQESSVSESGNYVVSPSA